jgi:predicted regulator of Ras-like GTPase activity (Roadblock/LC7/MglB family)
VELVRLEQKPQADSVGSGPEGKVQGSATDDGLSIAAAECATQRQGEFIKEPVVLGHDDKGLDAHFSEILSHDLHGHDLATVIDSLAATLLQTGLSLDFFQRLSIALLLGSYVEGQAGEHMLLKQQGQMVIARMLSEQRQRLGQCHIPTEAVTCEFQSRLPGNAFVRNEQCHCHLSRNLPEQRAVFGIGTLKFGIRAKLLKSRVRLLSHNSARADAGISLQAPNLQLTQQLVSIQRGERDFGQSGSMLRSKEPL